MMEWINSEQGVTVLRAAVLLMVLLWLLSGGFGFIDRFTRHRRRQNNTADQDKDERKEQDKRGR